eukprot:CAMPEP_0184393618 /NCGR_PEP_ID=MMETSP0007-20130409/35494_1 /TAXON_ID=97485 /ORGANISM="Prymnesium parvum, Strain Texoma1" /LENGTH=66 /DNA_ID=CAMNT_0026744725 /DNA_START=72 /DNA_END=268 /DNA_ORIENTATION=+
MQSRTYVLFDHATRWSMRADCRTHRPFPLKAPRPHRAYTSIVSGSNDAAVACTAASCAGPGAAAGA